MPSSFIRGKNDLNEPKIRDIIDDYLNIYKRTTSIEINTIGSLIQNIEYKILTENIRAITAENELRNQIEEGLEDAKYQLLNENIRAQIVENELRSRIELLENNETLNNSYIQKILNWIYNLTGINL
jgi:hypothetical protein